MTALSAPPTAYEMKVQESLRLSPEKVQQTDLPNFGSPGSNAMAWLFVTLCQAEAIRTGDDLWVGFRWNDVLEVAHSGNDHLLSNKGMAQHWLRDIYLQGALTVWQQPSVLFPTWQLLARH